MPDRRRKHDPAYVKMMQEFGSDLLREFHLLATAERQRNGLRSAGGDPDLFVQRHGKAADRFFVEVKLEIPSGPRPYKDTVNRQQLALFPLIETKLGCEVRLATVSVQASERRRTG